MIATALPIDTVANETAPIPKISVWRADPSYYQVVFAKSFPIIEDVSAQFGKSFLTWVVKFQNLYYPMYAVVENNVIGSVNVLDPFETYYWTGFSSELLFVGSIGNITRMQWFSTEHPTLKAEIPNNLENHKAIFDIDSLNWKIYGLNSTGTYLSEWGAFSFQIQKTNETLLNSWQIFGLFKNLNSKEIYLFDGNQNLNLPQQLENSSLGSLGFDLSDPIPLKVGLFDLSNQSVAFPHEGSISYLSLPNATRLFPDTFPSSTLMDKELNLYHYNGTEWVQNEQIHLDAQPLDLSMFTLGVGIGMFNSTGIGLQYFGLDSDADGLPDEIEVYAATSPANPDTDNDGMGDYHEFAYGLNPLVDDSELDNDKDGLLNVFEVMQGYNPTIADTDFGGALDGWEYSFGFDPLNRTDDLLDNDSDGLPNYLEASINTDPFNSDTDNDGLPDAWEYNFNLNPLNSTDAHMDHDRDGFDNLEEFKHSSHPFIADNPIQFLPVFIVFLLVTTVLAAILFFISTRNLVSINF